MNRTTPLRRKTRLRPRSKKRSSRAAQRAYEAVKDEVLARSHGHCDRCGANITRDTWEPHHRQKRSRGGQDSLDNLEALCHSCHEWTETNPFDATAMGHLVPSWSTPAEIPITRTDGTSWAPDENQWKELR